MAGTFLVPLDWGFFFAGLRSQVALGLAHFVYAVWAWVQAVIGYRRLLGVPVWLGVLLSLLTALVGYPFNMLTMRAPF